MNKSESIATIAKALATAQSEMGNATKDAKNPFFKSNYADLNAIREAVLPVLNRNRISVLQPTTVVDGRPFVETVLLHESGEFISSITEVICNKVNDAQSAGSGISYARRYGLQALVCVGAEDDDGNAASGKSNKPITTQTPTTKLDVKFEVPVVKAGGFGVKKQITKEEKQIIVENALATEGWD